MNLNFTNNLFLGKEELDHFKESLSDKGYRRMFSQIVESYGVVKTSSDTAFDALKVVPGTANGLLSINSGTAIDSNIDVMSVLSNQIDALTIAGDSVTRYVKLKYVSSKVEEGTVSINAAGQVTGDGDTKFTEKLRGLPNFPSIITFNDSTNTQEYTVASVTDDQNLQLNVVSGILNVEAGITYSIVGTFTPGVTVPTPSKYPMELDGYEITLEDTNVAIAEIEFILASVTNDGATTTIGDLRDEIFSTQAPSEASSLSESNSVIGVTKSTYDTVLSPKESNLTTVEWGFNSNTGNWSYNVTTNEIVISVGSGGSMFTTSDFTTGDFDGWLMHEKDTGKTHKILSSTLVTTTIVIALEGSESISVVTSDIVIVPEADHIEIQSVAISPVAPNNDSDFLFSVLDGKGVVPIHSQSSHILMWRHIIGTNTTPWALINDGEYDGPLNFDASGTFVSGTKTAYTAAAGILPLVHGLNHESDKASRSLANAYTGINTFNDKVVFNEEFIFGDTPRNVVPATYNDASSADSGLEIIIDAVPGSLQYTGFSGGETGKIFQILNSLGSGSKSILLTHDDAASAAANRMLLKGQQQLVIRPGESITFRYDGGYGRWVELHTTAENDWKELEPSSASVALAGVDVSTLGVTNQGNFHYKVESKTLYINFKLHILDTAGTSDLESATIDLSATGLDLQLPPYTTSFLEHVRFNAFVSASTTGSHTSQTARTCSGFVDLTTKEVILNNDFDSANWTHINDSIIIQGQCIIPLTL